METLPKLSELTPEQKRIMCAVACGAKIIKKRFSNHSITGERRYGEKYAWNGNEETPCAYPGGGLFGWGWNLKASILELPRYDSSLDAMAEAEATLTDEEERVYFDALIEMRPFGPIRATAIQRLDAFLIAKGLALP